MKYILLLEPPFCTTSLDLEEIAEKKKYYYLSMSDVYISELGGETEISEKLKELKSQNQEISENFTYELILEKYLKKTPRNFPNGFVLDPDCFGTKEELNILLEKIIQLENSDLLVIDIISTPEQCAELIVDYQADETEGREEIKEYFESFYPEVKEILSAKNIPVKIIESDKEEKEIAKNFSSILDAIF
jgi:hypothetical protein